MQHKELSPEEIELLKQKFINDELKNEESLKGVCVAVGLVRIAIHTTYERIHLGYLPQLTGEALNRVIAMEYLYRNTDIDIQGYNEPVCCTPFYYEAFKEEFDRLKESNHRKP